MTAPERITASLSVEITSSISPSSTDTRSALTSSDAYEFDSTLLISSRRDATRQFFSYPSMISSSGVGSARAGIAKDVPKRVKDNASVITSETSLGNFSLDVGIFESTLSVSSL